MSESNHSLPFTPISKLKQTAKFDIKREIQYYDSIKTSSELKDSLIEKDMLIKSQRNTIRLYEKKIENLENNNTLLKQIIGILSKYITEDLNDTLPQLPIIPEDDYKLGPLISPKKRSKGKSNSIDMTTVMNTISQSQKCNPQSISTKNFIFDSALQNNLYQDFRESDFLKAILDSQLSREEMQKVIRFLLGKTSQDVFLFKTRTILFETLSFFLSLRNVAFLNSPEIFLPRALEMLMDILEVEKITILLYDNDTLFSIAVTSEIPHPITVEKSFGHFPYVEESLIINSAHEDTRFDKRYDQICNFVTRNLACVPITLSGERLGILECCNKPNDFSLSDISLLSHISLQLAIGQVGLDIKEKLSLINKKPAINRGSIESCREALMLGILHSLSEAILELINCERVSIYLYNSFTKELISILATGIEGYIKIPSNIGIAGLAYTTNTIINTDSSHPSFHPDTDKKTGYITKEILVVPINGIGVVQCLNKKLMAKFSKIDEKRLEALTLVVKCLVEAVNNLGGILCTADINELCLQNVKEGIIHINSQGFIQKLNNSAAKILETKPEKITGANINEAFENELHLLKAFWECVKSKENNTEKEIKIKNIITNVQFFSVAGLEENPSYLIFIRL